MMVTWGSIVNDPSSRRSCLCGLFPAVVLLCTVIFLGTTFFDTDYKQTILRFGNSGPGNSPVACQTRCRSSGSEQLPKGIVSRSSDLEMRPLWDSSSISNQTITAPKPLMKSLLAIAVGIKQKETVDQIVKKFLSDDFTIMLFHYDGVLDEWRDLHWTDNIIHVSALNQTKWWFAKRFLHPDIVSDYRYIFLWDEDLDVQHLDPQRYIKIVEEEGLEISQPALDLSKSEVHHRITVRGRRTRVHRRMYKLTGGGRCYENSTSPPCTGWVEMMAPVFSKAAWRCAWHMIQNDLIHAWGLDMKLGYCSQGDRTKNVGVVDAEYIIHKGIPTLGGLTKNSDEGTKHGLPLRKLINGRSRVRIQSSVEQIIFERRWKTAVKKDASWTDPFPVTKNGTS
ncbi:Lysine ketoglutarate reductase trans-splicing related 1-like [Zostera marina]|uniref:Lysine ketoglutarate reductase trans-splicing related 1-like n=1 Tax=Zostera marina TaxID=29655 RepID=A0A0K9PF07_ZOSMR|nr:Lysine ketoglutarate reductase trans-splicing related 1-like [Zostera marina]